MSVAVIIAQGGNDLEIPCMIFADMQDARVFMDGLFDKPTKLVGKQKLPYYEMGGERIHGPPDVFVSRLLRTELESRGHDLDPLTPDDITELVHQEKLEHLLPTSQLFTNYYSGCGGCYGFTIREINFGTKFVAFNLD